MLCPIGTAPFYGGCKQIVSNINGLSVSVQYYLDVIWNPDGLFINYISYIFTQFIELVDQTVSSDCNVCRKMIDIAERNESASELIGVVGVEINAKCDYGLALTQLVSIRGKEIDVHINGLTVLTLLVRSDEQPVSKIRHGIIQKGDSVKCKPNYMYALLFEDIKCPRLELHYTELELFSKTKTREKDIFASFFRSSEKQKDVSKVSVCLETYFSEMSLNRAQLSDCKSNVLILHAELIYLTLSKNILFV